MLKRMASILIVDDDADAREPLARFLRKAGHQADCVPNGRDALASVLTETPDLVILDLFMPELDGPLFLEVVRSYLRLQSLPVIVLTALPESPMVDRVRHLKVNCILVKTKASLEDIQRCVDEVLPRLPQ